MEPVKIGVKFCGNCNPAISVPAFMEKLSRQLAGFKISPADAQGLDALLIVSGCTTDCTLRPDRDWPLKIIVAGETVDHLPCGEMALAETVRKKLLMFVNEIL